MSRHRTVKTQGRRRFEIIASPDEPLQLGALRFEYARRDHSADILYLRVKGSAKGPETTIRTPEGCIAYYAAETGELSGLTIPRARRVLTEGAELSITLKRPPDRDV